MENEEYNGNLEGDEDTDELDSSPAKYDITIVPNDFNIQTLLHYIDEGIIKIPLFQRYFVWDIKRSSSLIESLIMGLPIPQLFLYEEKRNRFGIVDGQQRLMSLYYFMKKRFPKKDARLRDVFNKEGGAIPNEILRDDKYFTDFVLKLPGKPGDNNRLRGRDYESISKEDKTCFDLRTIRVGIIKQHDPKEDKMSSIYELFHRLNSGGVNLKPQEIRTCMYYSDFYKKLYYLNLDEKWRKLYKKEPIDQNMKDVEIILRGFAMLIEGDNYKPPMLKFLNDFSFKCKTYDQSKIEYLENLFKTFLKKSDRLDFYMSDKNKFNISLYEAIFKTMCEEAYKNQDLEVKETTIEKLDELRKDSEFRDACSQRTTASSNVRKRLEKAKKILLN